MIFFLRRNLFDFLDVKLNASASKHAQHEKEQNPSTGGQLLSSANASGRISQPNLGTNTLFCFQHFYPSFPSLLFYFSIIISLISFLSASREIVSSPVRKAVQKKKPCNRSYYRFWNN